MGNHPSQQQQQQQHLQQNGSSSGAPPTSGNARHSNIRQLLRNTGALGLSKAELDARCKPSGLYPSCAWDDKQIRRLIGDGKLAARLKGQEVRRQETDTECPICFLNYAQVNQTKCCQASLCTECYLQVRPPREKVVCPFCNSGNLVVTLQQSLSPEAIRERQAEEQRAIEASIRSRGSSERGSEEQAPGFGSSLESDEHVALMRKRSSSMSDSDGDLSSLAMTVDERQALEAHLRAQQQSPLIQRMQQEEMERAFRNEREYLEQNAGRLRQRATGRSRRRDWARLIQAFEEGGGIQSMDDLAMLEAAMRMASMDNEASRRGRGDEADAEGGPSPLRRRMLDSRSLRNDNGSEASRSFIGGSSVASQLFMRGMSEEEQLAMAIAASLEETNSAAAAGESNTENAEGSTTENANIIAAENPDGSTTDSAASAPAESSELATSASATSEEEAAQSESAADRAQSGPVDLDASVSESTDALEASPSTDTVDGQAVESSTDHAPNVDGDNRAVQSSSEEAGALTVTPVAGGSSAQNEPTGSEPTGSPGAASTPAAMASLSSEPIVAQTGLAVSEVLGGGVESSSVAENSSANEAPEDATFETPGEIEQAGAEQAGTEQAETEGEKPVEQQDVQEAEAFNSSEYKSEGELKLSDEVISTVTTNSILPQGSKDKSVETVESGMSCEA